MHRPSQPARAASRRSPSFSSRVAVILVGALLILAACADDPLQPILETPTRASASLSIGADAALPRVSAGEYHTCAVLADGSLRCWGSNDEGQLDAPAGTFTDVQAGSFHNCALRTDGTIACWGGPNQWGEATPPAGEFVQLSAGAYHNCALAADGTATCWGWNYWGEVNGTPLRELPFSAVFTHEGPYTQVEAGLYHTCALTPDGSAVCWGGNGLPTTPEAGTYAQLSTGWYYTCALRADATIGCWGNDGNGQSNPPAGSFASVITGYFSTCALETDGDVTCWGFDGYGQVSGTPQNSNVTFTHEGPYRQVSVGAHHVCAVRADGSTECWGAGKTDDGGPGAHRGQSNPPQLHTFDFGANTGGGFADPVSSTSFNSVRPGQAVPIKFDLGGYHGMDIIAPGYPQSIAIACPDGGDPANLVPETTETAGSSALSYDTDTGLYGYVWKTDKAWKGTCRELVLGLIDGSRHRARFQFAR